MNMIDSALQYNGRGFSVIPVRPDKSPFIKWEQYQSRQATAEELQDWWTRWPNAMIGVVTGAISGVFVVDCDNEEAYQRIQELLPDAFITAIAKTPRGYHIYLAMPPGQSIGNATGIIPGVDVRGDGGYVIAPPSVNGTGKAYQWLEGLSIHETAPAPCPDALLNKLKYKGHETPTFQSVSDVSERFMEGRRDDTLFHIASCLVKGGCQTELTTNILQRLAFSCNPPFPISEVNAKIDSALKRAKRRDGNLVEQVRDWLTFQEGFINVSECHREFQSVSPEEKRQIRVIFHRLKEEGLIEKYGKQAGVYRRVDKDFEEMDFLSADGKEYDIALPLGLAEQGILYPGNIAVVAGSKEAGKTAFLLNLAHLNLGRRRVVYLNSEMGANEMRKRLQAFKDTQLEEWASHMRVYNLKSSQMPADFIDGSDAIWIVDFLEIAEDFSKIALTIGAIHDKLRKGIAFLGLQKADGKDVGRGADFSREKARLYIALDWEPETRANRIKIIDCKAWRNSRNPRGLKRHYKLIGGAEMRPIGDWFP